MYIVALQDGELPIPGWCIEQIGDFAGRGFVKHDDVLPVPMVRALALPARVEPRWRRRKRWNLARSFKKHSNPSISRCSRKSLGATSFRRRPFAPRSRVTLAGVFIEGIASKIGRPLR